MKYLYYLPAIGETNYDKKIEILSNNINKISIQLKCKLDIILNVYDTNTRLEELLKCNSNIENYYIHNKKGVLVELWKTNPFNVLIKNYDYIFFCYDDVKIESIYITDMINMIKKYNLSFISPLITGSTHKYMNDINSYKNKLLIPTNAIEIYFIIIRPHDLIKYFGIQKLDNKWTWGSDFLLSYFGFNTALYTKSICKHYFPQKNGGSSKQAYDDMMKYISRYGFKNLGQIIKKYPPIKNMF
jgi:hypothetical protein